MVAEGGSKEPHLRADPREVLPDGGLAGGLVPQGSLGLLGHGPPRQPRRLRDARDRDADGPPLRPGGLRAAPQRGHRLRVEDPARRQRRRAGQVDPPGRAVPRPSLRPRRSGERPGPEGDHARGREGVPQGPLHPRRDPDRDRGRGRQAVPRPRRGRSRPPALGRPGAAEAPQARGPARAGRHDRREAGRLDGHLDGLPDRPQPARRRLLRPGRRQLVPGRAPDVQRQADARPARQARAELRRLLVYRGLHPGRGERLPRPEQPAPAAVLLDLDPPRPGRQGGLRAPGGLVGTRPADRARHERRPTSRRPARSCSTTASSGSRPSPDASATRWTAPSTAATTS